MLIISMIDVTLFGRLTRFGPRPFLVHQVGTVHRSVRPGHDVKCGEHNVRNSLSDLSVANISSTQSLYAPLGHCRILRSGQDGTFWDDDLQWR